MPYAVYGYGAQMVELAVDTGARHRRLLNGSPPPTTSAARSTRRSAEGQIEGGIAQGIGMALMEEYLPGRTDNLHDYLIPTIGDVPEIVSILVEIPDPEGPSGAKGLGEHVLIPTAPAILNAIRHATGAEIDPRSRRCRTGCARRSAPRRPRDEAGRASRSRRCVGAPAALRDTASRPRRPAPIRSDAAAARATGAARAR